MRKKIVAILLIATMAMGIAACGGSGDKKDDNTITVWCWDKTFNIFAMEEAAKIYQEDHQDVKIDIVEVGDVWNAYIGSLNMYIAYRLRACLKNHFRNLQAPLCGIFYPHSVAVARYAALIRIKSPTNWDSQLTKSLFQTRSSAGRRKESRYIRKDETALFS